jgi:hypothetical protein
MELAKNSIGTMGIVFFVVAAAAPLTVVVAVFPVILGSGNGLGIVGTFLLVAAVLSRMPGLFTPSSPKALVARWAWGRHRW